MREAGRRPGVERPTAVQGEGQDLDSEKPSEKRNPKKETLLGTALALCCLGLSLQRSIIEVSPGFTLKLNQEKIYFVYNGKGETMLRLRWPPGGH